MAGAAKRGRPTRGAGLDAEALSWWVPGLAFLFATLVLFGEFVFSDRMLYGEDSLSLGYMARADFAERLRAGDFPLWAPRLLGGIPFVEALSAGDSIYPTSLLYFVVEPYRALGWKLVLHVLAGGFFMYGWARHLGLGRPAATVAGVAWLTAPVMATLALSGNDGKLMVAALAPLVFWATGVAFRRPGGRSTAGLAGAVALVSLTTQFQTAYFLFGSAGAFAVFLAVRAWRDPTSGEPGTRTRRVGLAMGTFLLGSLLGGGIAAVQLIPAARYVTESSRRIATTVDATPEEAVAYSSSWSLHPEEVVALIVPEFVGNTAADAEWGQGTYWGRNALKLNHEYLGATAVALALFALAGRRRRALKAFMATMSLAWLLFALGAHTPVWRILYEVVPGISLFRAPSLGAFLIGFGVVTLLALGLDDLVADERPGRAFASAPGGRAMLGFSGLLLAGLLLQSSGALAALWTTAVHAEIGPRSLAALERAQPFVTRGFAIALLWSLLAAAAVWAARERKLPASAALALLGVLIALDAGRIDRAFIRTWDFHSWAAPDANTRFLEERRDAGPPFRVADLRGSDQSVDLAMFGLDLVAGHHPNDLARYRQLLGLEASARSGAHVRNPNVLRLANVKYLLWPEEAAGGPPYPGAEPLSTAATARGTEAVYPFPGMDRAWVVGRHSVAEDDVALERMLLPSFDPAREAILAEPLDVAPSAEPRGRVEWELDEPDERRLRVRVDGPGLLVVSENWFPGWVAEIDGREVPVRRANLTFQAVVLPEAGEHAVELRFTAPTVRSALGVSALATVCALAALAISLIRARRRTGRPSGGA